MASVEYGNEDVVNASLEEALSWCTRYDCEPDKEMVIKTVFVALETASKMVCEPGKRRKPCNPICLDKFKGLFDYYNAKLCSDPRNVAEFMHKVLPGIIRLALNDCGETNILPRNIQDDRYLSASKTNCKVTVYEVNITREKIAVALARIFLCLVVPSQDEQFHCKPDCSRFFTRLDGTYRNSQEGKYLMFLQYFKHILKNGVPDGCVCYSKLIGKSPGYVPSRIMQWADSECCLCDFSVKTCGSIDERPSQVMQTDFANCYFGGSTLGGGAVQEEIMLCACPELIVAMLFVSRIRSLEAVQIKGYERFSCYTGYGARLRFAGPYVESQSSACNRRPSYMTAIDAYALHSDPELQYELDYVHRELNKALVGFTQAHSQANCFRPVATGNWGCGAFGGDPQLKSLIQWIAASRARCPEIIYYTFNDSRVSELVQIVRLLQSKTVSEVMCLIMGYCQARAESCGVRSLFEYIKDKEGGY